MAAGRPIVASDLPAIREVLTDEVNALLVAPGDAGGAGREPSGGCSPTRRSPRGSARPRATPRREYTWDRRAERLEALFARARIGARPDDLRPTARARPLPGVPR